MKRGVGECGLASVVSRVGGSFDREIEGIFNKQCQDTVHHNTTA